MAETIEASEIDRLTMFSHLGGRASGIQDVADSIMEDAVAAFKNGDEKSANYLRGLSLRYTRMAEGVRVEQSKYAPNVPKGR